MTKTVKQILTSLDKGEYLDKGGVDQALKELEAIMQQEIAKAEIRGIEFAFDSHDYDGMRKRKAELSKTIKELEAEL